jgi:Serine-threonine protein kinase 19
MSRSQNASHSPGIRKPGSKCPAARRSSSSLFAGLSRRKAGHQTHSSITKRDYLNDGGDDDDRPSPIPTDEELDASGKPIISCAPISPENGVIEAIQHARSTMFGDIAGRAGMNSTQIARTLNFQKGLPPILSIAHIHALINASTRTEREIAKLLTAGHIRKLYVLGRGNDISGLAEFLLLSEDLEEQIRQSRLTSSLAGRDHLFPPSITHVRF